jgi:pimeloyl-ACP methyl ester carboxylesterase
LFVVSCTLVITPSVCSQDAETGNVNLTAKTAGGKQFWGDELIFRGWRIQRHAYTRHCRLLDPDDWREAWGTFDQCQAALEEHKRNGQLRPVRGPVVVVLHGLGRTRASMDKLAAYLETEGGYDVVSVGYPSTRADVDSHARNLASVIEHLPDATEINLVAHSLGNIVIRRFLASPGAQKRQPQRIRRIVMLCPPNQGAVLAEKVGGLDAAGQLAGPAAKQLGEDWDKLAVKLATPACEFGILTGGRSDEDGYNKLIPGDDDLVVSVQSAKLAGARDFRVIPEVHTFFMNQPLVQQYTLRFLQRGYFESEQRRQPIVANDAAPPHNANRP